MWSYPPTPIRVPGHWSVGELVEERAKPPGGHISSREEIKKGIALVTDIVRRTLGPRWVRGNLTAPLLSNGALEGLQEEHVAIDVNLTSVVFDRQLVTLYEHLRIDNLLRPRTFQLAAGEVGGYAPDRVTPDIFAILKDLDTAGRAFIHHRSWTRRRLMGLIRWPGSRRIVTPPGITVGERHGEALVTPYERGNRTRRHTGELLGVIREPNTAIDEHTKRELSDFAGGLYDDSGDGMPAGLFTKYWLGEPYPNHILTFSNNIAWHLKHNEPVPSEFAMVHPLVRNDVYAFIKVYSDGAIILVRPDSNPVT